MDPPLFEIEFNTLLSHLESYHRHRRRTGCIDSSILKVIKIVVILFAETSRSNELCLIFTLLLTRAVTSYQYL